MYFLPSLLWVSGFNFDSIHKQLQLQGRLEPFNVNLRHLTRPTRHSNPCRMEHSCHAMHDPTAAGLGGWVELFCAMLDFTWEAERCSMAGAFLLRSDCALPFLIWNPACASRGRCHKGIPGTLVVLLQIFLPRRAAPHNKGHPL